MADDGAVSKALADVYGLAGVGLQRVLSGVATVNFVADADHGRRVFVKAYQPGADLVKERAAIELSEFAAARGVPTARVLRSERGEVLHMGELAAISVWEFVAGQSGEDVGLSQSQMIAVGSVVGHLHRILSVHPAAPRRPETGTLCDLGKAARKLERVLRELSRGTALDSDFRAWATEVLLWRQALLPRLATMLEHLPALTSQVVHGDLAVPNVLFHDGQVAAVIDFRPPLPRAVAWEVSRLGCDPRTVLRGDDWVRGFAGLATAYREENPQLPDGDLVAAVRAWVCYSGASIYPFDDLVDRRALLPESLQRYAMDRHHALVAVLERLDEAEAVLRELVGLTRR
ncbi:phosphotransferase enzyme family protein [Phytohabitans houttuyneae]|uniref:Aminoglycoside phosphotransferase domain-containing protein n=1 Tax=Phytohabitans houttuyneae TaxID=1076126 RepID=A0A6V8KIR6_9ACTN|nr:phosphotransferase [Phytohabitans houttuyneae]GFJ82019.1 hypothetical protein Phou_061990 [Phytohabitans houttuyneae]